MAVLVQQENKMGKIKIEDIRTEVESKGWKLISDTYTNLTTDLIYECTEGHKVYSPWKKMRNNLICPVCQSNQYAVQEFKVPKKQKQVIRTLSLDQATRLTGWSAFDGEKLIGYGVFETTLEEEIERDNAVKNWLVSMITNWKPDYVVLEGIQYQTQIGVTTFQTLARLQGILMNCIFECGIPYQICHTATWRHHCGLKGKTRQDKKRSAQLFIKKKYDITVSEDEADAICIGTYAATTIGFTPVIIEYE